MTAGDLDSWPMPGSRPPRARLRDARASHAAADRAESSGAVREGMRRVLEAVRTWPGLTSRELAERAGLGRHDTAKRLADLYRRRAVDRIEGLDERELRWWLAGAAPGGAAAHPSAVVEHGRAPSAMDFAIARARSGFRSAGRVKPTRDDVLAAAAIERRLQRVYAGELRARLEPDGRVRVEPRA